MKLDKNLLKFPRFLPNDLEGLMFYYPNKFPPVVAEYEKAARQLAADPCGFAEYGDRHYAELEHAFDKIKKDFDLGYPASRKKGLQTELEFLFDIDCRLHKMFCYRFWIVNYLFPDGPIHEFYVERLMHYARRLVDSSDIEISDYEAKVTEIQRDLIQGDYADLYLQNALNCVYLMELINKDKSLSAMVGKVRPLLQTESKKDLKQVYALLDPVIDFVEMQKTDLAKKLYNRMAIQLHQSKFRKTRLPVYTLIIHAIEFEAENRNLQKRSALLTQKIGQYLALAKKKFKPAEAEEMRISYKMVFNFSKYKDIMGMIDGRLLPFWMLEVVRRAGDILIEMKTGIKLVESLGPAGFFYCLSWYLPSRLKERFLSADSTGFSVDKI